MSFANSQIVDNIAQNFTLAALGEVSWKSALQDFADYSGSSRAQLFCVDKYKSLINYWVTELPQAAYLDFHAIQGNNSKINPRWAVCENAKPMQIHGDETYDVLKSKIKSNDYIDFSHKWDIPYGAQVTLEKSAEKTIQLLALRSKKDKKSNDRCFTAFADLMAPIKSALRLAQNLDNQSAMLQAKTLEVMQKGAIICDIFGRVGAMTVMAEELAIEGKYFSIQAGRIIGKGNKNQSAIENALADLIINSKSTSSAVLFRELNDFPKIIDLHIIPKAESDFKFFPKVIITFRDQKCQYSLNELQIVHGLTQSEAQVAIALCNGQTREEIAKDRNVSIETIRSQLRTIFNKMGINREIELASLIR